MRRIISIALVVSSFSLFNVASVNASAVRVALRTDVSIAGDVILLSHLLADPFPSTLRDTASRISLGNTPQLGTVRHIRRAALATALADTRLQNFDFLIPESVTIRRAGRAITTTEIAGAILDYFRAKNPASPIEITSSDLTTNGIFPVPEGDLDLYVKSSHYDAALHRGLFSLSSRAFPQLKAFEVNAVAFAPLSRIPAQPRQKERLLLEPVLVRPGVPAQLVVHAADTHMILSVVPARQGRMGDLIRVRLSKSATFLNAKVVGENRLEATY